MSQKATQQDDRLEIQRFQQIINVGPATERDFRRLGLRRPDQLIGRDPYQLYVELCRINGQVLDPCVLDVMMSVVDYMNGNRPRKWWEYTPRRKSQYGRKLAQLSLGGL